MSADLWPRNEQIVTIATKLTGVSDTDLEHARKLLDKALEDYTRAERVAQGSFAEPLYLPEVRWEMVRLARRMLGDA